MTKRIKSKHKVDRRLKANIWGRPKSPFNSRAYPPGQHGQNKKGKPTDYGITGTLMKDSFEIFTEKLFQKEVIPPKILLLYLKADLIQLFIEQNLHQQFFLQDK